MRRLCALTSLLLLFFVVVSISETCTGKASTDEIEIPKPSVPEFTVEFMNETIDLKIKNQPFSSYYDPSVGMTIDFYYNVRVNGSFSEDWIELYRIDDVPTCSSSEYTVLSYESRGENTYVLGDKIIEFSSDAKVAFQVEAMIGYIHRVYNPNATNPLVMYPYVFTGETSGWSGTQIATIPEFPSWIILPLFLFVTLFGVIIRKKVKFSS